MISDEPSVQESLRRLAADGVPTHHPVTLEPLTEDELKAFRKMRLLLKEFIEQGLVQAVVCRDGQIGYAHTELGQAVARQHSGNLTLALQ
jgi:Mn-dependent DtxR family transcriptional regulator